MFKTVLNHLSVFNQFWNLACVDVNHVPCVVHNVVGEDSPNVVRYLGQKFPNRLLGLVLPFLVLDVVPQKVSELEPVCERKIRLVEFLNGLWSCQCTVHDNGIYHLLEQSVCK